MTIVEMKEKRANLWAQQEAIVNVAHAEGRALTAEETQKFDAIEVEFKSLTDTVAAAEKVEERKRELAAAADIAGANTDAIEDRAEAYAQAFDKWARNGHNGLTQEERATLRMGASDDPELRALAVGTDNVGGYLVPEGFRNQLVESMKWFGGMVGDAPIERLTTATGNDIPVPTDDDTTNTGELLAENTAAAEQDTAFGQVILKAYMYSSKIVRVSFQLLQDSAFSIDDYLADRFGKRIGRILNTHLTTGDNSAKPQGVATAASTGKTGAAGQTATIIWEDLVDLEHSIDPAYRRSPACRFMMNDSTLKALKKLKDNDGRPLFLPGIASGEPDTILKYPYVINNDVAAMAAGAKSVLFGDFSQYVHRTVRDTFVLRLVERYAEYAQVGFIAFARHDGRLIDAGTDPIKAYVNAAS